MRRDYEGPTLRDQIWNPSTTLPADSVNVIRWAQIVGRAALGEEILDVSVAERETQVDPHGMLDDTGRRFIDLRRNAGTLVPSL